MELNPLHFRRQYLLTTRPLECPFSAKCTELVSKYLLYTHVDLPVTDLEKSGRRIVLLGDLFDFENHTNTNSDIIKELISLDFPGLLRRLDRYTGRFVLFFAEQGNINIVHDPSAARKVYYAGVDGAFWCSSTPYLLASVLGLKQSEDPEKRRFYESCEFTLLNNSNIGNTTRYDEILQLMPNHYLDLQTGRTIRYWPYLKIESRPFCDVVDDAASILSGYMKAIGLRYNIMLPVTAGKDSRMLMAASRSFSDKVFYYINFEKRLNSKSYDILIPKKLCKSLGLDFHIVDPYQEVDEEFRKAYFHNNPFASEIYLPIIYNYHMQFPEKVNLPGSFINIIEDVWETGGRKMSPQLLADLIHVGDYGYAKKYYSGWLADCEPLCRDFNINLLNLFYWEERMANWGTQLQTDKDIAQEEFIPYNSRHLISISLAADLKYREKPYFRIFTEIIRKLWPETLSMAYNPSFKSDVLKALEIMGIGSVMKKIYYTWK